MKGHGGSVTGAQCLFHIAPARPRARARRNFISLQKEASSQAREFLLLISTCFDSCIIVGGFVCLFNTKYTINSPGCGNSSSIITAS